MIRAPIAAWMATSNICRGISLRSRSTSSLPALVGEVAMDDQRERVDLLAADEDVDADDVARPEAGEVVVEARVAARARLELVVEVEHDLAERQLVGEVHPLLGEVLHVVELAAALVVQLHHRADVLLRHDHRRA